MTLEQQFVAVFQLMLAALLGGIIGLDRERKQHEAGLRTHILVATGACLFTVLSQLAFPGSDPARVASQIIPGIGFLGAGTILKFQREIHGLTTAASIWITASVGMAVGAGVWFLAVCGTLLIWFVLVIIRRFEQQKSKLRKTAETDTSEVP